jgi:putative polyketide hydroxylase
METKETQVLVAGCGAVGLTSALLLGRAGVSCIAVDRRSQTSDHPRARGLNLRTTELMRQWGLEHAMRRNSLGREASAFAFRDRTLVGREWGRTMTNDGSEAPTVVPRLLVPQYTIEDEIRMRARECADIRFETELLSFVQDEDGVTSQIRDLRTGVESTVRSDYLLGADGPGSLVRGELGVELIGDPLLSYWLGIYWRSTDERLWKAYRERPGVGIFCIDREHIICFSVVDDVDRWMVLEVLPPTDERPTTPTEEEAIKLVRDASGIPDLEIEIYNSAIWRVSAQVADRYRDRRVLLAGDAAHLLPHTGGLGLNTGVADAHNLAWKLALVVRGHAHDSLLDTYGAERAPVARQNADWCIGNNDTLRAIIGSALAGDQEACSAAIERENAHVTQDGADLGASYESSAVVPDGSEAPIRSQTVYVPVARPGHRAPHVWIDHAGVRVSTTDVLHSRFVLLAGADGTDWRDAARAIADRHDFPLMAATIGEGGDLTDPDGDFLSTYGIGRPGAVLVRPDGHVAWRDPNAAVDAEAQLVEVLEAVVGQALPRLSAAVGGPAA